ncbi:Cys-tRNA(Pro) deacylase [Marinospirillum alkaliphilum]|uniref:Cys-tRNA(Pro)/Cys-tRNA(Cys) deacylase n=1 Tax=Marinospirillum alkaliphilum DSM 21637 TaxID=1122209 RepID=A0A1K1ZWX7_9GAMM|nr:Cys-tRNA(Pro) deacylase [Marinospirillum alkaliphilum]SFX78694.1 Cys-tRNA(Pro)/Cys-tRNA(Cys) deacylase [Marinospirillum alkaliphilum DSM 21637]
MTPAINLVRQKKVAHQVHEYSHDPAAASYGLEAAEKMGVPTAQVFKTLVTEVDGKLVVAVLPVDHQLSLKKVARAAGGKKAVMADPAKVERTTGYVLGGVSPLGQKKALPTLIDASAENLALMYVSAGRRGLEISLAPSDLQRLTNAIVADLIDA